MTSAICTAARIRSARIALRGAASGAATRLKTIKRARVGASNARWLSWRGVIMDKQCWWEQFDWSASFGITDPESRAHLLADMFADDAAEYARYHDEILADILRAENRLN
jgi:hypothetical protein